MLVDLNEVTARPGFYRYPEAGGSGEVSGAGIKALTAIAGEERLT